jgi:UDP-N-acetylglucosamine 2-epimerase (non-hydrolysing)
VAVVLGTRPEIIKLAGIIRLLGERGYVVHSGQHYDPALSDVFFDQFELPKPEIQLSGVGGASRGDQFATIISQITDEFSRARPRAVVVQGDTNTAAATAQAAYFLEIPVVHVEAGLRSYDLAMPEEINRRLIGVVASLHCAPTTTSRSNLVAEGVLPDQIEVTGNTVVEATRTMLPDHAQRMKVLDDAAVTPDGFVLATIHRPENTDDPERLEVILRALGVLEIPVILPVHPRTLGKITDYDLDHLISPLRLIEPLDHATFLALASHAKLLISDSGGVQEECTVIKRPLLVLRNSTERPEAIEAGFARRVVPGPDLSAQLISAVTDESWGASLAGLKSPFGDGSASERIIRAIDQLIAPEMSAPPRAAGDPRVVG